MEGTMLPRRLFLTCVAASLIILSTVSGAQNKPTGMAKNVYNPAALETISGEVVDVDLIRTRSGRGCCLVLKLRKADNKTVEAQLGPSFYVEEQPVELRPKDKVDVTGSWITRHGVTHFVAGEVRKGNEVIRLRDEKGRALWLPHKQ